MSQAACNVSNRETCSDNKSYAFGNSWKESPECIIGQCSESLYDSLDKQAVTLTDILQWFRTRAESQQVPCIILTVSPVWSYGSWSFWLVNNQQWDCQLQLTLLISDAFIRKCIHGCVCEPRNNWGTFNWQLKLLIALE